MPDYQQSKIYMIRSESANLTYYGSTIQTLSKRIGGHRADKIKYENGKYRYVTSFKVMEYNDYQITLVEKFPCNDKEELNARERWYISNNECVNKVHPGRIYKEYYEENREIILEKKKIYREENKEAIKEKKAKKYTCPCGSISTFSHKAQHERTQKHKNWIEQNV